MHKILFTRFITLFQLGLLPYSQEVRAILTAEVAHRPKKKNSWKMASRAILRDDASYHHVPCNVGLYTHRLSHNLPPHILDSTTMTSNKESGKEASNAGMQLVCKGASCSARQVIMESIAGLVDKAAASNGSRVPRGYVSKVIKQFLHLAPGLTRH